MRPSSTNAGEMMKQDFEIRQETVKKETGGLYVPKKDVPPTPTIDRWYSFPVSGNRCMEIILVEASPGETLNRFGKIATYEMAIILQR